MRRDRGSRWGVRLPFLTLELEKRVEKWLTLLPVLWAVLGHGVKWIPVSHSHFDTQTLGLTSGCHPAFLLVTVSLDSPAQAQPGKGQGWPVLTTLGDMHAGFLAHSPSPAHTPLCSLSMALSPCIVRNEITVHLTFSKEHYSASENSQLLQGITLSLSSCLERHVS